MNAKRQSSSVLGKFTRPRPVGALARTSLFRALDHARQHPAVWISGPPGAGKTTLVSTYVAQRRLRTLWFRMHRDDADPATFFHDFALATQAAGGNARGAELPHLTSEYQLDLATFTRRYFEQAFRRLKAPCVIVLDDCHEIAQDAVAQEVIRELVDLLPDGANLIAISRSEPSAVLAGQRAKGRIALLGGEQLKLSVRQCREIARLRGIRIDLPALQGLHERTQGWTAGVVLALEQRTGTAGAGPLPAEATPEVLFDYFAGDIFGKMASEVQALLLRAALLPSMAAHRVVELTGTRDAGRILGDLARSNYFTLKLAQVHGAPPAVYQFHPMFREFLLRRCEQDLPAAALEQLRCKAATLLEADGEIAESVALLIAAQAWKQAMRVLFSRAEEMLRQGRGRVLEGWLRTVPAAMRAQTPWALYWLGRCRLAYDPVEARAHFEQAFVLFEAAGDAQGLFHAWASVVDTFLYERGDFAALDRWIAVLDERLARDPKLPTAQVEALVACGMFTALMYRQPHRPDLPQWAQRVRSIVVETTDVRTQMILGNQLVHYYTAWLGDLASTRLLIDALRPRSDMAGAGPLAQVARCAMEAKHHWYLGAHEECLRVAHEGLEITRRFGTRFSSLLETHGAYAHLSMGDVDAAERLLSDSAARTSGGRLHRAHNHFLAFLCAFYRNDTLHALASVREAVALADSAGVPLARGVYRAALSLALFSRGNRREALACLAQARRIARRIRSPSIEFSCAYALTYFLLERGKLRLALPLLRRTLETARQRGYLNRLLWTPEIVTRLLTVALEHGIEVEFVQEAIRRRGLTPTRDLSHLERWPFAVKLYTLGRFGVLVEGKPLEFSGKAQRKPLELLMALVAFGGRDVSERQLTEVLWPDAEGDAAHQACAVTLHRLRKLLACDEAVTLQSNQFSLNPQHVWVDAWAFERFLASGPERSGTWAASDQAVALYQGPFLGKQADLAWAIPLRERLRTKFMRHLAERGRALCEAGEFGAAVGLFEKGLNADPLAEEFYRQLMVCYQALDRRAEAIGVYRRCEKTLAATVGLAPAAKTVALYQELQS